MARSEETKPQAPYRAPYTEVTHTIPVGHTYGMVRETEGEPLIRIYSDDGMSSAVINRADIPELIAALREAAGEPGEPVRGE